MDEQGVALFAELPLLPPQLGVSKVVPLAHLLALTPVLVAPVGIRVDERVEALFVARLPLYPQLELNQPVPILLPLVVPIVVLTTTIIPMTLIIATILTTDDRVVAL